MGRKRIFFFQLAQCIWSNFHCHLWGEAKENWRLSNMVSMVRHWWGEDDKSNKFVYIKCLPLRGSEIFLLRLITSRLLYFDISCCAQMIFKVNCVISNELSIKLKFIDVDARRRDRRKVLFLSICRGRRLQSKIYTFLLPFITRRAWVNFCYAFQLRGY